MVRKTVENKVKRKVSKDNDLRESLSSKVNKVGNTTSGTNCGKNKSNKQKAERQRKAMPSMRPSMLSELLQVQEVLDRESEQRRGLSIAKELDGRMIVYIMGPYSASPYYYTSHAMRIADAVLDKGGIPFIPHLTHFWDKFSSKPWEFWIAYDLYLVDSFKKTKLCAVRIPGHSNGADIEERFFVDKGLKVYKLQEVMNLDFKFPRRKDYGR